MVHTIHPASSKCSRRNGLARCRTQPTTELQLRGGEGMRTGAFLHFETLTLVVAQQRPQTY